ASLQRGLLQLDPHLVLRMLDRGGGVDDLADGHLGGLAGAPGRVRVNGDDLIGVGDGLRLAGGGRVAHVGLPSGFSRVQIKNRAASFAVRALPTPAGRACATSRRGTAFQAFSWRSFSTLPT